MKKVLSLLILCLGLLLLGTSSAFSTPIGSGTVTLDGTESLTSQTRVLRDGIVSTWAAPKGFPDTLTEATPTDYFETVSLKPGLLEYVRVTYEEVTMTSIGSIFLTGYLNSFNVNNLVFNYLGDSGASPSQTGQPLSFEMIVPTGNTLVLAFETTGGDSLSFGTVSYTVEGFAALVPVEGFAAPVPEPTTIILVGSGLLGLWGAMRKFRKESNT